jgi:hypothetical protein
MKKQLNKKMKTFDQIFEVVFVSGVFTFQEGKADETRTFWKSKERNRKLQESVAFINLF